MSQRKVINLVTKDEQEISDILEAILDQETILVVTQNENEDLTIYGFKSVNPILVIGLLDEAKQAFRNWWWNYKDTQISGEPL